MTPPRCSALAGLAACPRVAVVGNAPEIGDHAAAIDAAGAVVRFNNAAGFGARTGRRVTHLALVNRGGQARAWVEDPDFPERAPVRAASTILLPFPPLAPGTRDAAGEPVCWTAALVERLAPLGLPVAALSEADHAVARRHLAPGVAGVPNPSTGFHIVLAILRARPAGAGPIDVYGFGFAGWPGHPWAAERRWFAAAARAGRLRLHPLA